ncbi:hypothetical protein Tco_0033001 [Tanacetum coccineum]
MAPVAYVDYDTNGLGCTVAIAIMDARCLTKEGYADNHPAGLEVGIYLFNLKNTLEKLEIAARVITEINNPQYVDCSNPAIPYWNRELTIDATRVNLLVYMFARWLNWSLMYGADGWENVEASVRVTEMLQMDGK